MVWYGIDLPPMMDLRSKSRHLQSKEKGHPKLIKQETALGYFFVSLDTDNKKLRYAD